MGTTTKRQVKWGKRVQRPEDMSSEGLYTSKCGRYTIEKTAMASGRNGHWNASMYTLTILASATASKHDSLLAAKDGAEYDNDPTWEPC